MQDFCSTFCSPPNKVPSGFESSHPCIFAVAITRLLRGHGLYLRWFYHFHLGSCLSSFFEWSISSNLTQWRVNRWASSFSAQTFYAEQIRGMLLKCRKCLSWPTRMHQFSRFAHRPSPWARGYQCRDIIRIDRSIGAYRHGNLCMPDRLFRSVDPVSTTFEKWFRKMMFETSCGRDPATLPTGLSNIPILPKGMRQVGLVIRMNAHMHEHRLISHMPTWRYMGAFQRWLSCTPTPRVNIWTWRILGTIRWYATAPTRAYLWMNILPQSREVVLNQRLMWKSAMFWV